MGDQPSGGVDDSIVGGGASPFTPAGFRNTAAVPGGPTPPAVANLPNANLMTGQPHYTGPTLPGPAPQQRVSNTPNIAYSHGGPQQQAAQGAIGGIGGLIAALQQDWDPRQWQGILHEPEWQGMQHQHTPVQPVQPVPYDHSVTINNPTVADPNALAQRMTEAQLSRYYTATGGLPAAGIGSP